MLYIIGIGPGDPEMMTLRAAKALRASRAVVGYRTYIELLGDLVAGKEIYGYGMREEVARALKAIELASRGVPTAIVSSGDPNVYGMAPLVFEAMSKMDISLEVEVLPGVTAALAAAARLGAPLGDFAVINLSDLLTPRDVIYSRVEKAAAGDFVMALYNPISREVVEEVFRIIRKYRAAATPVGVVKNAYRQGEEVQVTTLADVDLSQVDMRTTIVVGNSETYVWRNYMVTPRGYSRKYSFP